MMTNQDLFTRQKELFCRVLESRDPRRLMAELSTDEIGVLAALLTFVFNIAMPISLLLSFEIDEHRGGVDKVDAQVGTDWEKVCQRIEEAKEVKMSDSMN